MDDATRRMHQDFEAFFPRGPELRATIQGEGVWRWFRHHQPDHSATAFKGLRLTSASMTSDSGELDFVALRESDEEIAVPTEALRDLLTTLQELPDAARLLVGSEITLTFRPGS